MLFRFVCPNMHSARFETYFLKIRFFCSADVTLQFDEAINSYDRPA